MLGSPLSPWRAILALAAVADALAAVTGQEICNQIMCVKALRDNDVDTYTVQPVKDIPLDRFGWVGVGFGIQMMVIMWPNGDGTFTLSQRHPYRHTMPAVVDNPPRVATLHPGNTFSNATTTALSFSVPADGQNTTSVLWALSRTNPGSADPNSNLLQHTWRGLEFMSLDSPYDGTAIHQPSPFPIHSKTLKDDGGPSFVLIAHIVCGAVAAMLVLPGGVVVPRITRGLTTSRWWFKFHALNQGLSAIALVCAAWGIAYTYFGGDLDTRHRKVGTALLGLIIIQTLLGLFAHFFKPNHFFSRLTFETKRGRGPSNFLHVIFGIVSVGVAWGAAWTGLTSEWHLRGHGIPAQPWRYGWGLVIMIWLLAYILGVIFLLPRQLRIESREREIQRYQENLEVFGGSAVALARENYIQQRAEEERAASVDLYSPVSHTSSAYYVQHQHVDHPMSPRSPQSGITSLSGESSDNSTVLPPMTPRPQARPTSSRSNTLRTHSTAPGTLRPGDLSPPYSVAATSRPSSKYTPTVVAIGLPPPPRPKQNEGLDGHQLPTTAEEREMGDDRERVAAEVKAAWEADQVARSAAMEKRVAARQRRKQSAASGKGQNFELPRLDFDRVSLPPFTFGKLPWAAQRHVEEAKDSKDGSDAHDSRQ